MQFICNISHRLGPDLVTLRHNVHFVIWCVHIVFISSLASQVYVTKLDKLAWKYTQYGNMMLLSNAFLC